MSTVNADFGWFPIVPRPRPPALPLDQRITELTALAARATEGTCQQRATRAAAVLNNAALIASDCGVIDLALTLRRRQYELFTRGGPLPGWAVRLALQPALNIPRQLVRNGQGGDAHTFFRALHQAAADQATVDIGGISIDFAALASTPDARREALMLTWTALLADGTRALARAGRWKEAASYAAAHHGAGTRLLDGRQAAILALLAEGQPAQAAELVDQATVTERWERAVQAVLRVMCQHASGNRSEQDGALMTLIAYSLAKEADAATAVTRTRIGLTVLPTVSPPRAPTTSARSCLPRRAPTRTRPGTCSPAC